MLEELWDNLKCDLIITPVLRESTHAIKSERRLGRIFRTLAYG
jgi:hypothetical protein